MPVLPRPARAALAAIVLAGCGGPAAPVAAPAPVPEPTQAAVAAPPEPAPEEVERAAGPLLAVRQLDEARALAERCLAAHPDACPCLDLRARIALRAGQGEAAVEAARAASARCPGRGAARLVEARVLRGEVGDADEALRALAPLAEDDPDDAETQLALARAAEKKGDTALAWRAYTAALRADPDLADARYGFAKLAIGAGERDEARRQADRFAARWPEDPRGAELAAALAAAPGSSPDDPIHGKWSLADAVSGLPRDKTLVASIETDLGKLTCKLFDDKAPITVANFVGLARGLRPWRTPEGTWEKRPLYDGSVFHRIIRGFMIQGGDPKKNGTGEAGFTFPDELWPGARHDRAGLLCTANRGPNTNSAQFFITDANAPHLDKGYTIFGECSPVSVVHALAAVPVGAGDRPDNPPVIRRVTITRK